MRVFQRLLLACATVALIGAAFSAPAAAAGKVRMTVVQGIPSVKVDVCINNVEIRSSMAYGSVLVRSLPAGSKTMKVYPAKPGSCAGLPRYGKALIAMPAGSDKTAVLTRNTPKVLVFDDKSPNDLTTAPYGQGGWIVVRHASDVGPVSIKAALDPGLFTWAPMPSADPQWVKGQAMNQSHSIVGGSHIIVATLPDTSVPIASTSLYELKDLVLFEHILVGTNASNVRFVNLTRKLVAPTP
jgi:hypothetical protein